MPRKQQKSGISEELESLSLKLIESEKKFKAYCAEVAAQNEEYKTINEKYSVANEALIEKNSTIIKILNELRWNEVKFRQMFSSSPAGIFYYDNNLVISELNAAFSETLSAPYHALKGLDMNTINDKRVLPCIKAALKGEIGSYTGFYKSTLSGKEVFIKLTTHPLYSREDSNKIIGGTGLTQDLTDWKIAQEKLEENQENLRLTLQSIGECVVVTDLDSNIVNLNRVAEQLLDCKAKNVLGKPLNDVFSIVSSKTKKTMPALLEKAFSGKTISMLENAELHTPKNKVYQISLTVSPISKADGKNFGAIMIFQDITERTKILQKHFESETKFKSLFENSPTGIALIDVEGNIKEVNNVILALLGSPSAEATKGINVLTFEPLVSVGFSEEFKKCVEAKKNVTKLAYYVTKWKKGIYVQYTLSPISENDGIISGVILNIINVTAQKEAEEKEKKYYRDLELITKSSIEMLELPLNIDPLKFIGERLKSIIGDNTVIINKYCEKTKTSSTEYVFCIESRKEKFNALFNKEIDKLRFNNTPQKVHNYNFIKKLVEIDPIEFFVNACFFPEKESSKIIEIQKVNKVYFMGICPDNKLLANLIIITYNNEIIENKKVIETFINQTSLVLQRRIALKNLSDAEQLYNNTLNSISEFIHVTDNNLNVIFANAALKNIYINLGLNSNIEGLSIKEASPFLNEVALEKYNKVIENKSPVFSEETTFINGRMFHTETILTPVIENDEITRIITSVRDVTEGKKAELELIRSKEKIEESENRLQLISGLTSDYIFQLDITENGGARITYLSENFYTVTGRTFEEANPENWRNYFHPDDVENAFTLLKLVVSTGSTQETECRTFLKDGRLRWVSILAKAKLNEENSKVIAIVGSVKDITERKKAEEALVKSENHLRNILELSNISMAIINFNGIIEFINQQAVKTFGYLHEDIPNMDCWWNLAYPEESYRKQTIELFMGLVNKAVVDKCEIERREYYPTCKDGTVKTMIIFGVIVEDKIFVMFEDITERKIAEEQIKEALKKAEESDKLKSAFLANMSHELRTPINGIIGFSNLLLKPDNTVEKKEKYVSQINASTAMLLRLIEDIIDIAKIESGSITIEKSPCKLSDILNELYLHYKQELKARGKEDIKLVYNKFSNINLTIITDPFRLRQVLLNLLSNAVKFTNSGEIEYGFTLDNKEILFYVKDTGIGIKQEHLTQIFERFAQLELSLSRKFGGTGLGLTISKNIIEFLGGTIWVESEWEKGSTFYFKIPADIIPASNEIVENAIFNANQFKWNKFTILVAEDDDLNFMFIEEMLLDTEVKLIRAKNGLEAIDLVKINPEISLVLMDIQMPFMDGYQSTKLILSIRPDLPIIAQTAFALASEKEMSFKAGCIDYISKPLDVEELHIKIKKYLPFN